MRALHSLHVALHLRCNIVQSRFLRGRTHCSLDISHVQKRWNRIHHEGAQYTWVPFIHWIHNTVSSKWAESEQFCHRYMYGPPSLQTITTSLHQEQPPTKTLTYFQPHARMCAHKIYFKSHYFPHRKTFVWLLGVADRGGAELSVNIYNEKTVAIQPWSHKQ